MEEENKKINIIKIIQEENKKIELIKRQNLIIIMIIINIIILIIQLTKN